MTEEQQENVRSNLRRSKTALIAWSFEETQVMNLQELFQLESIACE